MIYSADGGEVISRFGAQAADGKTMAETPEEIHQVPAILGPLAVDGDGTVYIADEIRIGAAYHRLMVFKPETPDDHEHYIYKGEVAAGATGSIPISPVTDDAGNVYVVGEEQGSIEMFGPEAPVGYPAGASAPICRYLFNKGGITGMTVNPATGEVFFFSEKLPRRLRRIGPCDEVSGKFGETEPEPEKILAAPERASLFGLAFDATNRFTPSRGEGILYGGAPSAGKEKEQSSLGYIFALPEENPPVIESQSVSRVTPSSAELGAAIDARGFASTYSFQYLGEAAYQANEPDERQALTVSASGGLFGLGFEGRRLGGAAMADLSAGSTSATVLKTATATATLRAASGSGDLNGAKGKGTVIAGLGTLTRRPCRQRQLRSRPGDQRRRHTRSATTIAAVESRKGTNQRLTISTPATKSVAHSTSPQAPTDHVAFHRRRQLRSRPEISGAGIAPSATIASASAGELTLSDPVTAPPPASPWPPAPTTSPHLSPGSAPSSPASQSKATGFPQTPRSPPSPPES